MINKPVIRKWIDALRSGDYKQTTGALHDRRGFCCLGVLCDLYIKTHKKGSWEESRHLGMEATYDFIGSEINSASLLPDSVIKWAGLESHGDPILGQRTASRLNDSGSSFETIATLVEQHLLKAAVEQKCLVEQREHRRVDVLQELATK